MGNDSEDVIMRGIECAHRTGTQGPDRAHEQERQTETGKETEPLGVS